MVASLAAPFMLDALWALVPAMLTALVTTEICVEPLVSGRGWAGIAETNENHDKGLEPAGRLEGGLVFGGMCTHWVRLTSPEEVDAQVSDWLRQAYEAAG